MTIIILYIIDMTIIQRSYKFRYYPTQDQAAQLAQEFGCARYVWNRALAERSEAYQLRAEKLNYVGLSKLVTVWKQTDAEFLQNATANCLTQALIDQDKAFKTPTVFCRL